jgi:hypothetical protein
MLTAQTENRGSGDIRVANISCQKIAEIVGILSRAAASGLMKQEFDAVNIRKNFGKGRAGLRRRKGMLENSVGLALTI